MTDSPTRMPPLVTDRLVIRQLEPADLAPTYRLLDLDEADLAGEPPPPIEHRRDWLQRSIAATELLASLTQPPYTDRAITLREGRALIGICGLNSTLLPSGRFAAMQALGVPPDPRPFYAEVGLFWHLALGSRGQGFATEAGAALIDFAFTTMRLQRVVATTEYANTASQAVMRRLGMTIERNPQPDPHWLQIVATIGNPHVSEGEPFAPMGSQ
jgi:[ribosomal protein S5]-alanine N-acetyltransferase